MEEELYTNLEDATEDNLYPALFQCFTIILCGYIAGRLNVVTSTESKGIATFVGTFALPSLIFLSLARLDFSTVNWRFLLAILLAKGVVFFGVMIVTILVSKPVNLGRAGIFPIFCTQSNDFALGYPIISALYKNTHPEYAFYLYLMAPISLAILNPIAFVLMEIYKQQELSQSVAAEQDRKNYLCTLKLLKQIAKGIAFNPVLVMTVLGIIGNNVFKHELSVYIEGLLEVFGQSFSATALFLLGLRIVGQIYRLRGPALVLPCVLIIGKLVMLPLIMRECVSALDAGVNATDTASLSNFAFLYGTIPTAPAVFVFSNLYQLEIDLMASSMVMCTILSAPMMFFSAQLISINKDFADQLKRFGFDLSIVSLVASLWVILVFTVTKKYKRMPHRLTLCLIVSQLLLAISVIWGGPLRNYAPSWQSRLQRALCTFSMYSCLLWNAMLSVGLLMLESRGASFVVTLWPVLGFVAWGAPAAVLGALLATDFTDRATDAIRLCLLVFCLTVTIGCLIVYMRFRRRSARFASLAAEVANSGHQDEATSLVNNAEPISINDIEEPRKSCYGAITATSGDPNLDNGLSSNSQDIEDINKECSCPASHRAPCRYLGQLEAAGRLGLPPDHSRGQIHKHTILIIVNSLSMFIGVTYTTWRIMMEDERGVFVEVEFLDITANYGQALVMLMIFGFDPAEVIIPTVRYFKNKWYGADTLVLPAVEDLPFETKHVCDQFITHHLERCKEVIAKDTKWRMRACRSVFRGACLVRWLVECGLAKDEQEALQYGRHLLDGRLIAHINDAHHFTDSPLLYIFK